MAIIWKVEITPLNVDKKEANVTATRTDDVTGNVETHRVYNALLATQAQKTTVVNTLWELHLAEQQHQIKIEAYISDLAVQAKANLEARET
ncbi:MAG TPA: hypothetical protein HPP87_04780 [Planctomycetes bacterium]|nr:hypothetical protein [Planctomycetota bacterium]